MAVRLTREVIFDMNRRMKETIILAYNVCQPIKTPLISSYTFAKKFFHLGLKYYKD